MQLRVCGTTRLYAGFGSIAGIPSTCLQDTVLLPLPTFLLILTLPFLLRTRSYHPTPPRTRLRITFTVVYSVLAAATCLMLILEVVRLSMSARGFGLLPLSAIGVVISIALHYSKRSTHVLAVLVAYWGLMAVLSALQTATLVRLTNIEPRLGTKYPAVDQITDVGVLLGLYVILTVLEVLLLPPRARASAIPYSMVTFEHHGKAPGPGSQLPPSGD